MNDQTPPTEGDLPPLIVSYATQIDALSNDTPKGQIFELLLTRDRLAKLLEAKPGPDFKSVERVAHHDARLKKLSNLIEKQAGKACLPAWRQTLRPAAGAWWWFLDEQPDSGGLQTWLRRLWNVQTAVVILSWTALTLTAAFMGEITRRALAGNPDWVTSALTLLQGLVGLYAANQVIARRPQRAGDPTQSRSSQPSGGRMSHPILALGLFILVVFTLWQILPWLSARYYDKGYRALAVESLNATGGPGPGETFEPALALEHLQRAVSLDPSNVEAHYRLGIVYDFLYDADKATSSYRAAMAGPPSRAPYAAINIANPLLDGDKFGRALDVLGGAPPALSGDHTDRLPLTYLWYRQRGWALLGLSQYEEAARALTTALAVAPEAREKSGNPALGRGAHCLLAQLYEKRLTSGGQADRSAGPVSVPPEALNEWEQCLTPASDERTPVEEQFPSRWRYQGCERLRASGRESAQCSTD